MQIQTIHWQSENRTAGYSIVHRREVLHSSNPFLIGGQIAVPPRPGEPLVFIGGGVAGAITAVQRHRVETPWADWLREIRRMAGHYKVRDAGRGGESQWLGDWLAGLSPLEAWARRCFNAA